MHQKNFGTPRPFTRDNFSNNDETEAYKQVESASFKISPNREPIDCFISKPPKINYVPSTAIHLNESLNAKINNYEVSKPTYLKSDLICRKNFMSDEDIDKYINQYLKTRQEKVNNLLNKNQHSSCTILSFKPKCSIKNQLYKINQHKGKKILYAKANYKFFETSVRSKPKRTELIRNLIQKENIEYKKKQINLESKTDYSKSKKLINFYKDNPRFYDSGVLKLKITFKKEFQWAKPCKKTYLDMLDNPEFCSNLDFEQLGMILKAIAYFDQKDKHDVSKEMSLESQNQVAFFKAQDKSCEQQIRVIEKKQDTDFIKETIKLGKMFGELGFEQ
ncbi:hypothetical protein QEN19_000987 [Hanseniaspora menglaensis]